MIGASESSVLDQSRTLGNVVIVDDSVESLRLLGSVLRAHGFEARPVTSGEQAIRAVASDPPDLVLLDVEMPTMDGFETCRRLKESEALKEIPVVFLTARTSTQEKVRAFEAGGVDYITKPFQVEEVVARVRAQVELRQARQELQASYRKLTESERLRDHLIHMVVHDVRTPLQTLVTLLDILPGKLAPEAVADIGAELGMAREVTRSIGRLAKNLLDARRLEDGKMRIRKSRQQVRPLVRDVVDQMSNLASSQELVVEVRDPLEAEFDEGHFRRMLENLLGNAIKHSPLDSAIEICARADGDDLLVEVADAGPGVPEALREKIFEPFTSLGTENSYYFSAGLGLAFCHLVVEAHGGSIGVKQRPGGGSVFWFRLPRFDGEMDQSA